MITTFDVTNFNSFDVNNVGFHLFESTVGILYHTRLKSQALPQTFFNFSLSFDLTERNQLLEACHYTNLQPLWAKDNLSKGDR
jgi:hypothetical protein